MVWGKELYIDSTQVNANADLDSLTPRFAVEACEAHLAALFAREDAGIEQQEASGNGAEPAQTDVTYSTCLHTCSHISHLFCQQVGESEQRV